jgi:hypothetical protein
MKTLQTQNHNNKLIAREVLVDPSLDKLNAQTFFKEKVEAAKEFLLKNPVPKEFFS